MAKVITFSKNFPSYHFRKGEPTHFIQKFWASIKVPLPVSVDAEKLEGEVHLLMKENFIPKHHTIRGGKRWKVGDKFSPRVWSGKPYNSKQIILADDVEVKQVFDFEMDLNGVYAVNGKYLDNNKYETLAMNDGLTEEELFNWFMPNYNKPKEFVGQIICWNENVSY